MKLYFLGLLILVCHCGFAQSDTTTLYYNKDYQQTISDSAATLIKFYKNGGMWHGKEYYAKTMVLKSDGDYTEMNEKSATGTFNNYTPKGKLDCIASWDNGKPREITYYYPDGSKKSWANFTDKGIATQKGWDEAGKEIKNYIVARPAVYKGGEQAWIRYLQKNLDANVATNAGAPAGSYTVVVHFKVGVDGYPGSAKAVTIPAKCKPCANEAVRVILGSGAWQPAISQNQPSEYQCEQGITFEVAGQKKKQ